MFHEVKECKNIRKDAFLTSSIKFWEWPYWIFAKGLRDDCWAKLESLLLIGFVLNRVEKIFWRY